MGAPPRSSSVALVACTLACAACSSAASDQVTNPVVLGMASNVMPLFSDETTTAYEVQLPVPLPVRAMTGADLRAVGPAPPHTPYPRGVFLRAEDESIEVHFTLTNLDSADHDVWLLVDPWNEFVRWVPGVIVTEEETIPNFGYDQLFTVPAGQRLEGSLTTDDMHEIAIKLASVENMLASTAAQTTPPADGAPDPTSIANNIFNPQNRSNSNDPLYTPWIPPVVAGLTGFDLGLRTSEPSSGGSNPPGAPEIAVELTMEIQDLQGNRFVVEGSSSPELGPPPADLSPPGARL